MLFKKRKNNFKNILDAYKDKKTKYAVEMLHITKEFQNGKIKANQDITLKVKKNEIHALIGENGAGKTTLLSILFGSIKPTKGKILINGLPVNFNSSNDATQAGIGMVHQHFKLVNVYSLLQNIILGAEKTKFGFINYNKSRTKILELSKKYNLKLNLDTLAKDASVGEQQRAEIMKLLYRDVDILIFDEPTAVLSDEEIKGFLLMLKDFKKMGKTIIIVTHKLDEVKAVADSATIIRKGCFVDYVNVKKKSKEFLTEKMIGKKLVIAKNDNINQQYSKQPIICEINNLSASKISQPKVLALNNLNLKIHSGEILGLAGIEGNGQTELALILGGILKNNVKGNVIIYNNKTNSKIEPIKNTPKKLYDFGVIHIPEDRLKYGLIGNETSKINTVLPQIDKKPFTNFGFLNNRQIEIYSKKIFNDWNVQGVNGGKTLAKSLSGGNQQKLVIGREMARKHSLAIFVQPTRGLDLGAIQMVHERIVEEAKRGIGVLLISYELDEIFSISSRIAVINRGKIVYNNLVNKTTRAKVGKYLSNS